MKTYGRELILDLKDCKLPFTRNRIQQFMEDLCALLDMERADLHFWDYETEEEKNEAPSHLAGTSAVQFITTSNITIHTLDKLKAIYLNIFTCADLNVATVTSFCTSYWEGKVVNSILVTRQ